MRQKIHFSLLILLFSGPVCAATYTVTNANDSGPGSLRQAMLDATASSIADIIEFNITGTAPHIINVGTSTTISLPECSGSGGKLTLDGTTQPANGYTGNSPKIILDGTAVTTGSDQDGLNLWGNASEVYGLYIRNFPHNGIAMAADNGIIGAVGKSNIISGNGWHGVYIFIVTPNVTVQANLIGLQPDSISAQGNGDDGVHVWQSSNNNLIGGATTAEGNLISFNENGIYVRSGNFNRITHNSVSCNDLRGIYLGPLNDGNQGYAAPTISSATTSSASGSAAPNDIVELFLDDNCNNCEGKTFVASVTADGSGAWSWSGVLNGTNLTATATNASNNNTSAFAACMTVTGPPPPPGAAFSANATQVCPNALGSVPTCINFSDISSGTVTGWAWSFPGGTPATSIQQNPSQICYDTPGTYDVTLIASNSSGADTSTLVGYITVHPAPTAYAGPDQEICRGDTAQFTATGGVSYHWFPTGDQTATMTVSPLNSALYRVLATDQNGCADDDTVMLTVHPLPTVFLGNDTTICTTCTLVLDAGNAGTNYLWNTGVTTQTLLVDSTGTYIVEVSDGNGCEGRDTIFVDASLVRTAEPIPFVASLFPNPAIDRARIQVPGWDEAVTIELWDMSGKIVLRREGNAKDLDIIDLRGLASGMYAYQIKAGAHITHGKLVVFKP